MTKCFIHCLFFVLCSCIFYSLQAQKLTYKIFLNKDTIGNLIAERSMEKENVHYLLTSKMLVDKIINVRVEYKMQSEFSNGKMVQSTAYQKINNKVQVNSGTQWNGSVYNIKSHNKTSVLRNKPITYNMCMIYFYEPVGITQVYSDALGVFLKIRPVGNNHRYELTLPDGKKNYYNYASGLCFQVETEQLFSKIIFRLTR